MKQKINMFNVFKIKKHNKNYKSYQDKNDYGKDRKSRFLTTKSVVRSRGGFTLLEVLMVIGILAILAGVVLVAINPARQFKIARDSQRNANVSTILNAIGQNLTDHGGVFTCEGVITDLPTTKTNISSEEGDFNVANCLVPDYISVLPFDPSKEGSNYTDEFSYNTGYSIESDVEGRITISADGEVSDRVISVTR
ncbi:MAG: type II secretion system GspH family protein [Candidatus Pacebacteria bacterium]|nr:type II secretion system GspH family protein [Candidatus Paceibacterota bacterium]